MLSSSCAVTDSQEAPPGVLKMPASHKQVISSFTVAYARNVWSPLQPSLLTPYPHGAIEMRDSYKELYGYLMLTQLQ